MDSLGLHNLTPDDEALLASVGIDTKAQFLKLGANKAYKLLQETNAKLDDKLIFRLRGAEDGIDWKIVHDKHKRSTKSHFADID